MTMKTGTARRAAAILCGAAAFVLSDARGAPSEDWSIETVTVTAQAPGPAFWHVQKGDAEVWILAVVEPVPVALDWNRNRLDSLLATARQVLLPARAETGFFEGLWFLAWHRDQLSVPDGQTLDGVLGGELAQRFAKTRQMVHRDADRYADNVPAVAALRLEGDFLRANSLSIDEPAKAITTMAQRHNKEVHRVATYDAMPGIKDVLSLPPAAGRKCVEAAVNDVDYENQHAVAAAQAWAVGDVATVKANYVELRIYDCLLEISAKVSSLDKRATADTAGEIEAALAGGGRTVAVINFAQLLRKNGVLEKLLADGVAVEGPSEK